MGFNRYRSALASTTSALALSLTAIVPSALAQQEAQGLQLEEIIVNARRVDENIQRVPIAITAFSPEKLAQQDIKDAWTLTKSVNGFAICCSQGNASFVYIRGINNGTPTYFNDVPLSNAGGFSGFFDVSNVQVLKGPQGTLFGQASNAGALVYTPKRPGEVFGGNISVSAGNYGRRTIEGAVDVPIVEDKVLFRMAAQSYYREGFIEDIRTQRHLGDQNYYILRPSLTIRPTENIENYTLFQLTKQKGMPLPFVLNDINFSDIDASLNPARPAVGQSLSGTSTLAGDIRNTQRIGNMGLTSTPAQWYALRDQVLARQIALGPYKVDGYSTGCNTPLGPADGIGSDALNPAAGSGSGAITNLNYARAACQYSWSRELFFSNTTTWNFADNLSLKNIFGYRTSHSFSQPGDTDGTPLILFDSGSPKNGTVNKGAPTWSDELQLQGTKMFGFLDFTVGTFHTGQQNKPVRTYGYSLGVSETLAQTKTTSKSRAVYGQANVDIGYFNEALEGLSLTGGYRYTWDHITQVIYSYNSVSGAPTTTVGLPGTASAGAGDGRFSAGVYTLQLQYQVTPDVMVFFNNSKGYSAGGLQNVLGKERFQPDVLTNYEGGLKGTFDLGPVKLRTATSYFYGDFSNVKVSVTQLANTASAPTAPAGLIVVTENAATAKIHGLDSEVTIIPTDWFELNGNIAITNTKFTKWDNFINTGTNTVPILTSYSSADSPFSGVAKWKWTLRPTLHASWLDEAQYGAVSLTASLTYTSTMNSAPGKPRSFQASPGNPNTTVTPRRCRTAANGYGPLSADGKCVDLNTISSFYNLDLNLDWRDMMGQEGLNGSVFVTNVTKNETAFGGCYCDIALGLNAPAPAAPRMFGVRLGYSF